MFQILNRAQYSTLTGTRVEPRTYSLTLLYQVKKSAKKVLCLKLNLEKTSKSCFTRTICIFKMAKTFSQAWMKNLFFCYKDNIVGVVHHNDWWLQKNTTVQILEAGWLSNFIDTFLHKIIPIKICFLLTKDDFFSICGSLREVEINCIVEWILLGSSWH